MSLFRSILKHLGLSQDENCNEQMSLPKVSETANSEENDESMDCSTEIVEDAPDAPEDAPDAPEDAPEDSPDAPEDSPDVPEDALEALEDVPEEN